MNFGQAIDALKAGKRVTRTGWNGRGMYLWLMPEAVVKAEWCREPHLREIAESNGGEVLCLASIRMFTVNASGRRAVLTGWLASQSDARRSSAPKTWWEFNRGLFCLSSR